MNTNDIVNFFFEIASLRRLTRSHRQLIQEVSDNISDHSFRVAVIGLTLAKLERVNADKVTKMCLFHDIAEARTGDANYLNQQYLEIREQEARQDQLSGLPIGEEVNALLDEYEKRQTPEAIVAKDADLLDQMILQQEYFYQDQKNMNIWQNHTEDSLKTPTAKNLAQRIRASNPLEWLYRTIEQKTNRTIKR